MNISKYSSLARVIDPRYPTNLAIVILSIFVGGVQFLLNIFQGIDLVGSIFAAVPIGLSVFLTWALGREIDPEHELSAFAGLVLVIPGYWLLDAPDLIAVVTILLLLRLLNRTTGREPKLLDSLTLAGLGIWLLFRAEWIFGLITAAAFFLDSRLSSPKKQNFIFSGIMTILTVVSLIILEPAALQKEISSPELFFVIGVIVLFIPLIIHTRKIDLMCDFPNETINPLRVQVSQIFAVTAGTLVWLYKGKNGLNDLLPVWSSIIAVSLAYLSITLLNKVRQNI